MGPRQEDSTALLETVFSIPFSEVRGKNYRTSVALNRCCPVWVILLGHEVPSQFSGTVPTGRLSQGYLPSPNLILSTPASQQEACLLSSAVQPPAM